MIEMLRAHKPDTLKTAGVNVNIGTKGDIFVLTEDQRHELQRINREWLLTSKVSEGEEEGVGPASAVGRSASLASASGHSVHL